ncbi:hypothetical protein AGOR_G00043660 [Albula goreensis]|uniref:Uncharacterized protein n=1 Tax=Albula goreensis TaxID=1534307 RepID=A0A8T3DZ67_9TELE|nr:hypothetical protein AGOR_G00043660 [Albula goreensis]
MPPTAARTLPCFYTHAGGKNYITLMTMKSPHSQTTTTTPPSSTPFSATPAGELWTWRRYSKATKTLELRSLLTRPCARRIPACCSSCCLSRWSSSTGCSELHQRPCGAQTQRWRFPRPAAEEVAYGVIVRIRTVNYWERKLFLPLSESLPSQRRHPHG